MASARQTGEQRSLRPHHKERVSRAREVRRWHHNPVCTALLARAGTRTPGSPGPWVPSWNRAGAHKAAHPRGSPGHFYLCTSTPTVAGSPSPPYRPLAEHRCAAATHACIRPVSRVTPNSPMCCLKYPAIPSPTAVCAVLSRPPSLPRPGVGLSGRRKTIPKDPPLRGSPEAGSSPWLTRVGHWKVRGRWPPWPLGRRPQPLAGGKLDVALLPHLRASCSLPLGWVPGSSARTLLFFFLPVTCHQMGFWAHLLLVTFTPIPLTSPGLSLF